ncbi:MAG TPA: DUF350 domain-containing protein [Micromonosporaceae bacterium]
MTNMLHGALASIAFTVLGAALLLAGFLLVDWLTPGRLREQIWIERNRNAAVFLSSALAGMAAIVFTSIITTYADLVTGLTSTAVFGLLGLLLMAGATRLVDLATPGDLGEMLVDPKSHPAVWVSSTANLAVASIVCASIT